MSDQALLQIEPLTAQDAEQEAEALARVLHACVHAGASVGFVLPFAMEDALAFWREAVIPAVAAGRRRLFVARLDGRLVGTAQLDPAAMPNQRHRGEVCKLLVHPDARRRGIARALMSAVEAQARAQDLTLLTLDTRSGDAAEPLYLSLGFQLAGRIPAYARAPAGEELQATSVMFKRLDAG